MGEGTSFTDRELDVMSVLWRHGSGTVAEVRDALADEAGYTTVLKILQILEEKGMVRHEQEGRAYRYHPVVESGEAGGDALERIVDKIFHGSAELAVARLVESRPLDADEVERMKALLDQAARSGAACGSGARPPTGSARGRTSGSESSAGSESDDLPDDRGAAGSEGEGDSSNGGGR